MSGSIAQGTSQTHGNTHILHFLVRLPRRMEDVWPAVATPEGLGAWCTAADVLEARLDGAVTLRDLGSGRVTAWDVDRVAEYTVERGGRIRFHLERGGDAESVLRFTHEFQGEGSSEADWRGRFERLIEVLESPQGLPVRQAPKPAEPPEPGEPLEPLPGQFT
jgi:Polyketide cyclase / dehydrase and lipid transport